MSDSLGLHGLQHARLLCLSLSPRVCSNSCPLSQWCHPTSSSVAPFSSCSQSFPASVSFLMSQLFTSGGQSIGDSASTSVSDAIQPSCPLLSPSPPTFNLSQHQGLFQWVSFSHQVAKVFEFQLQHQSFQWIFRVDFL